MAKAKLLRFKVRGNWVERWHDGHFCKKPKIEPEPTPIIFEVEEKEVWRLSVGMNFVLTKRYYGALIQQWYPYYPSDEIDSLKRDLIHMVERYVGYPPDDWWFLYRVGWGIQEDHMFHERYEVVEESMNAEIEAET